MPNLDTEFLTSLRDIIRNVLSEELAVEITEYTSINRSEADLTFMYKDYRYNIRIDREDESYN